jgi:hypothetical protein
MSRFINPSNQLFKNWPIIRYNGTAIQRFQSKIAIVDAIRGDPFICQFYTIQQSDKRPDIVSRRMYGTPEYDWLILTLNVTIDPFFEWPMDNLTFEQFIEDKYKTSNQSGFVYARATTYNYIQLKQLSSNTLSIQQYNNLAPELQKYWKPIDNNEGTINYAYNYVGYELSKGGYDSLSSAEKQYWSEQSYYDYEIQKNNNNKVISLISPSYISRVVDQHSTLIRT